MNPASAPVWATVALVSVALLLLTTFAWQQARSNYDALLANRQIGNSNHQLLVRQCHDIFALRMQVWELQGSLGTPPPPPKECR